MENEGNENDVQEVHTFQEVPKTPMHCGAKMRRMQHPSASTGKMIHMYVCAQECGFQFTADTPKEETTRA